MVSAQSVNSTGLFRVTVRSRSPEEARMLANAIADVLPQKITDTVTNSSVEVVDYAVTPKSRVSPNYFKFTAVGLLAGVLLSGALFVIRDMRDDIIRGEDYLLKAYAEVPILGVIPDINAKTSRGYGYYGKGGK
jgi:capsular polysaccharide biosynthesis protein